MNKEQRTVNIKSNKIKLSKSKLIIFYSILAILILLPIEVLSYAVAKFFLTKRGLVYDPSAPTEKEFNDYLQKRHPILGWPSPQSYGTNQQDIIGSRINTYFPNPSDKACVSAYGDSYTWSDEVEPSSAWPNQLSKLLDCRVNNFGVRGYGTDQALLRLYENKFDKPEILILGHTSVDITRNVNQFRGFFNGGKLGFKPRFIVDENSNTIKVVDLLDFSEISYKDVYKNPKKYFDYDYFIPEGERQLPYLMFPYSLTIVRVFLSKNFRIYLDARSDEKKVSFEVLYEPSHPSDALQVTEMIIEDFKKESIRRDRKPLIIVYPIARDLFKFESTGKWSYQNLLSYLDENNITYINIGEEISSYLQKSGKEICDLYQRKRNAPGGCSGHFNQEGYQVVADSVYQKIRSLNYKIFRPLPR